MQKKNLLIIINKCYIGRKPSFTISLPKCTEVDRGHSWTWPLFRATRSQVSLENELRWLDEFCAIYFFIVLNAVNAFLLNNVICTIRKVKGFLTKIALSFPKHMIICRYLWIMIHMSCIVCTHGKYTHIQVYFLLNNVIIYKFTILIIGGNL